MVAFVRAQRPSRCRSHDSINSTMVVARPSEPALQLRNRGSIAIPVAVWVTITIVVSVWVAVAVISVRISPPPTPERETKRVNKHEPVAEEASIFKTIFTPIVEKGMAAFKTIFTPIVETVEATKPIIPIEVAAARTLKAGGGV